MNFRVLPYPRKRFGQNFLVDQNIAKKILNRAAILPEETVLEIGPGRGALTRLLCERSSRVVSIEIDSQLFTHLQKELKHYANLDLHLGDALAYPFHTLPARTVVVANLPYNISTPLLFKLLEARTSIDRMILMVQLEVAKRIAGSPGTREYGVLSVIVQYFAHVDLAFKVSSHCFRPKPDVESAVIELRLKRPDATDCFEDDVDRFIRVVKASFGHRRKTLSNALRDAGFKADVLEKAFHGARIDGIRRAETVTVEEFQRLARALPFT